MSLRLYPKATAEVLIDGSWNHGSCEECSTYILFTRRIHLSSFSANSISWQCPRLKIPPSSPHHSFRIVSESMKYPPKELLKEH